MWAHFLGYGFTKPIDDMGPHNPPSHPELLDALGEEFTTHSYDLKELIRWIVLSEPYALSSKFSAEQQEGRSGAGRKADVQPLLSAADAGRRAVRIAAGGHRGRKTRDAATKSRKQTKREWLEQFTLAFGTDDNDETTTFNGTIPQTLMMMNGDLIKKAIEHRQGQLLASRGRRPED